MNPSINDELVNKIFYLHKALDEAKNIIKLLETQNSCLKEVLTNLTDYSHCLEHHTLK